MATTKNKNRTYAILKTKLITKPWLRMCWIGNVSQKITIMITAYMESQCSL